MIEQISVYTENKKGSARKIFGIFAEHDINVLCFVNGDSGEFGTMRLIVSDPVKAVEELKKKGYLCKLDKVIAAELEDVPGTLEKFLHIFEWMNISISYMYVGYRRENNMPIIIVRCEDMDIVAKALEREGYTIY